MTAHSRSAAESIRVAPTLVIALQRMTAPDVMIKTAVAQRAKWTPSAVTSFGTISVPARRRGCARATLPPAPQEREAAMRPTALPAAIQPSAVTAYAGWTRFVVSTRGTIFARARRRAHAAPVAAGPPGAVSSPTARPAVRPRVAAARFAPTIPFAV